MEHLTIQEHRHEFKKNILKKGNSNDSTLNNDDDLDLYLFEIRCAFPPIFFRLVFSGEKGRSLCLQP